jgi:hypothetical protein
MVNLIILDINQLKEYQTQSILKQKKIIMKTILTIWHNGNRGKTETLREFSKLLLTTFEYFEPIFPPNANVPKEGDFRLVIKVNGKTIGIESKGDPNTKLEDRLIDLADNFNCDIILCSSRISGQTVSAIDKLRESRNFQIIWSSTYQIADEKLHPLVNQLKAKHILELLQTLHLI